MASRPEFWPGVPLIPPFSHILSEWILRLDVPLFGLRRRLLMAVKSEEVPIGASSATRSTIVAVSWLTESVNGPTEVAKPSITSTSCSIESATRWMALTASRISRSVSSSGLDASCSAPKTERTGRKTKSSTEESDATARA